MNQRGENRLERHRADYLAITGKPFEHFFCPILFNDEPGELMRGHVINEAFKGSSKAWVVQRGDVDRFYGGFFEGDFELLQYMQGATQLDYFRNKRLFRLSSGYNHSVRVFTRRLGSPENQAFFEPCAG